MSTDDAAWLDYRRRFAAVYDDSNYGGGLQGFAMRAGHRLAEERFGARARFDRVIEIGSGTGAHAEFVQHQFGEYRLTDLDPKALDVARARLAAASDRRRFTFEVQSGARLDCSDGAFDRLVATHVLEHLYQPHEVLKEWRRAVRPGGIITVLLPTDPGFAWRLGRSLGPRRHSQKLGVDYDYVMAREHVNPINNLIAFLRHYFPERSESWWPLRVSSIDANLFYVCHAVVR